MSDTDQSTNDQSDGSDQPNAGRPGNAPSGFEGTADGYINSTLENVAGRIPGADGFVKNEEAAIDERANAVLESEEKNLPGGLGNMFGGGDKQ